jgi:hypothetical protein
MEDAADDRHGEDGGQRQAEQGKSQLCIAKLIVLLEYRDVRRPNAEGEAIADEERGNSSARGCCR